MHVTKLSKTLVPGHGLSSVVGRGKGTGCPVRCSWSTKENFCNFMSVCPSVHLSFHLSERPSDHRFSYFFFSDEMMKSNQELVKLPWIKSVPPSLFISVHLRPNTSSVYSCLSMVHMRFFHVCASLSKSFWVCPCLDQCRLQILGFRCNTSASLCVCVCVCVCVNVYVFVFNFDSGSRFWHKNPALMPC